MDEVCPVCHAAVKPTDFFCYNCGKNLHAAPLGTSPLDQAKLYLGSVFLAPMGFIWGLKYLRAPDQKLKIIGIIAMTLTTITLLVIFKYTVDLMNTINSQIGNGIGGLEGL